MNILHIGTTCAVVEKVDDALKEQLVMQDFNTLACIYVSYH